MKLFRLQLLLAFLFIASSASVFATENDIPQVVKSVANIEFRECDNSVSGVRTFCGHGENGKFSVVAITDKGSISGTIYDADGNIYDISNDANGNAVLSLIDKSVMGQCALAGVGEAASRASRSDVYEYPADSYTAIYDEDLNVNTGRVSVYRTAIPFTYLAYKGYPGYVDKDKIYAFWAQLEAFFNKTFGKQLAIRLEVIKDDRLIISDSTNDWPGGTSSNYCYAVGTSSIADLIGDDAFDTGIIVTNISTASDNGLAALAGVYNFKTRANAVARPYVSTIAHELGHLFGSNHTGNTASSSYRTEPGEGNSLMGYGYERNEFSYVSAFRIRRCQAMNSYYADEARTQLVENEKNVNGYTNFVYARQTDNHAPVINTANLSHAYTIPKGSLFQFNIDATDADGDELKYNAMQADISYSTGGFYSNPKVAYQDETTNPCVKFQPKWMLSSSNAWSLKEYTDVRTLPVGAYRFWLQANDGKDDINHGTGYAAYETVVNVVAGTAFEMTGSYAASYTGGDKVNLTWDVDKNVFGDDSRVRILLSDDFGATWKYVLCESAPNNGSAEVILPNVSIGKVVYGDASDNKQVRAGVIKVEVIDNVAYAVTALQPYAMLDSWSSSYEMTGGFTLSVNDAISAVNELATPTANDDKTYDLNGRQVKSLEHGNVYIRGGRKAIAK